VKKFLLAAIALSAFAAFLFWPKASPLPTDSSFTPQAATATAVPTAASSAVPASPPPSASNADLAEETRAAVTECWKEEITGEKALLSAIEKKGAAGKRELQWRVIKTEEKGQERRVRLGRETRESGADALTVQVFAVDENGLPEPLPAQPGQRENPSGWLNNFLRGKVIVEDARLEEITLANGQVLSLESEGNELTEAQFQGAGKNLACSKKGGALRCRCL